MHLNDSCCQWISLTRLCDLFYNNFIQGFFIRVIVFVRLGMHISPAMYMYHDPIHLNLLSLKSSKSGPFYMCQLIPNELILISYVCMIAFLGR